MIIIEGPDGGGKTTLVKALSDQLGLPVASRVVGSDTRPLVDIVKWTQDNVHRGFQEMIFDRHRLISEPIYSPLRDEDPTSRFLDLSWVSEMTWLFYQAKPVIIYALPGVTTVEMNVGKPETDNKFVADWIRHIYAGYVARASADLTRPNCRLYNYTTTQVDDIVGWVDRLLDERIPNNGARPRIPGQQSTDPTTVSRVRRPGSSARG